MSEMGVLRLILFIPALTFWLLSCSPRDSVTGMRSPLEEARIAMIRDDLPRAERLLEPLIETAPYARLLMASIYARRAGIRFAAFHELTVYLKELSKMPEQADPGDELQEFGFDGDALGQLYALTHSYRVYRTILQKYPSLSAMNLSEAAHTEALEWLEKARRILADEHFENQSTAYSETIRREAALYRILLSGVLIREWLSSGPICLSTLLVDNQLFQVFESVLIDYQVAFPDDEALSEIVEMVESFRVQRQDLSNREDLKSFAEWWDGLQEVPCVQP